MRRLSPAETLAHVKDDRMLRHILPDGRMVDLWPLLQDETVVLQHGIATAAFVPGDDKGGVYEGHYLARRGGKTLLEDFQAILQEMWTVYGACVIVGFVNTSHLPALRMSARLGFEAVGLADDDFGDTYQILKMERP